MEDPRTWLDQQRRIAMDDCRRERAELRRIEADMREDMRSRPPEEHFRVHAWAVRIGNQARHVDAALDAIVKLELMEARDGYIVMLPPHPDKVREIRQRWGRMP